MPSLKAKSQWLNLLAHRKAFLVELNMTENFYQHHVFFCLNQRDNGEACCMDKGAEAAFDYMKARAKKLGLTGEGKSRINRSGCLDRCGLGPLMVIYPQAVWYTFVDNEDIDEIIESHLVNGKVVERLVVS
jgi:(2Fe-2S) ferredoxin